MRPYFRLCCWQTTLGPICLALATPAQLFHLLVWKRIADQVIMANQHDELMGRNDRCARMYQLQMAKGERG